MQLYYFETPNPRKPCAVAKYLNLPVEYIRVDLAKGEQQHPNFLAINPNGFVPALVDGEVKLWESHAIMAYLAQKAGSDLWPTDPLEQIEVIKWLLWDTTHFSRHAGRLWFENYVKGNLLPGEPDQTEIDDATVFFKKFAGVLNTHLSGKQYMVANRLTIADFGVAPLLADAEAAKFPLAEFPEIQRWYSTMAAIEAWTNPWPA